VGRGQRVEVGGGWETVNGEWETQWQKVDRGWGACSRWPEESEHRASRAGRERVWGET
jgi:hypothetical protein